MGKQDKPTGPEQFLTFLDNPKESPVNILQDTHKYIPQVIEGKFEGQR